MSRNPSPIRSALRRLRQSALLVGLALGLLACQNPLANFQGAPQARAASEYKLYFKASAGTVPQAYVWYGSAANPTLPFGSWGATQNMQLDAGSGWYVADLLAAGVPLGQSVGVIFKNASGSKLSGPADQSRAATGWCRMENGNPAWYDSNPEISQPAIEIHFKSPWSAKAPSVWLWEGSGSGGAGNRPLSQLMGYSWPGPDMSKDVVQDWWVFSIAGNWRPLNSGLKFKFASGAEIQLEGAVTASKWFDGAWHDSNPDQSGPSVAADPGSKSFSGASLAIRLKAANPASGSYRLDGAEAIPYTHDQVLTIDTSAWVYGAPHTLVLQNGSASESYSYTRVAQQAWPDTLGALYTPAATKFRIWSPDSANVSVAVNGATYALAPVADFAGYTQVYEATVSGDLKNQSYQFSINGSPVRDPYAKMVEYGTTKGIVIDSASILPSGGAWVAEPPLVNREDAMIYEAHVRDFTIDPSSGVDAAKRGKFAGMVQGGTNYGGAKTGLDHLKELGVTHVQLMPVYDFNYGGYGWGYDPANYNVPDNQYGIATDPEGRIREFKDMVNEYHRNGIRVVMDVVYNHSFDKSVFSGISAKYYTAVQLSGCGNSLDDGNAMVSRMIRDSLEYWVKEYHIDGFRFDLFGVFRAANAAAWGGYLNAAYPERNLLIYGEPWQGGDPDPNYGEKVVLGKAPTMAWAHIALFNDQYRAALKGGSDDKTRNYIFNASEKPGELWWGAIAAGMRGSIMAVKGTNALGNTDSMFAYDPEQTINYVSAHDNLNLWDKIVYAGASGGGSGYAGRVDRFAAAILFTSQGLPFISEGDEFLHSKVVNNDWETAKNSFTGGDLVNAIRWSRKLDNSAVSQYYRDAIQLRKSLPALRLTSWDAIKNQVRTVFNAGSNNAAAINTVHDASLPANVVVSYYSSNPAQPSNYDTVVVYNNGSNFTVGLPAGSWTKVFDINGAVNKSDALCEGTAVTVFKKN